MRESKTYDEAINDPVYGNRWREAINEEFWNLNSHQTYHYTFLLTGRKVICCKWVFKFKYYLDCSIERYKARLVAQRFSHVHGIDYTETFASTVRHKSLKIFLGIVAMLEMLLIQMDVVRTYLESALGWNKHLIFMKFFTRMSSRSRKSNLQNLEEPIQSGTSGTTLE